MEWRACRKPAVHIMQQQLDVQQFFSNGYPECGWHRTRCEDGMTSLFVFALQAFEDCARP